MVGSFRDVCASGVTVLQKTWPELMPWASVQLERLSGQSWWASLGRCRRPRVPTEIGLTLALELVFWESPGSFVTSHPLSKLLYLGNLPHPHLPKISKALNPKMSLTSCCWSVQSCLLSCWLEDPHPYHLKQLRCMVLSEPALLRCQGVRVGSLDTLRVPVLPLLQYNCIYGHSNKYHLFCSGAGVQRFFLTQKSKMTRAVIKGLCLVCEPAV